MASKTTYYCDECEKKIPSASLYSVLFVSINSPVEPDVNAKLELCNFSCLEAYARRGRRK